MNWDMIGAVSSAFGALGVIVTVIYLAVQIRQNTRSVEGATEQELMALEVEVYALLAAHADVYSRGALELSQLAPADRYVFENLVAASMSMYYTAYVQWQRELISDSVWTAYRNGCLNDLSTSGFLEKWNQINSQWPKEFVEALEAGTAQTNEQQLGAS